MEDDKKSRGDPDPVFKKISCHTRLSALITSDKIEADYLKYIFAGESQKALDNLNKEVRSKKTWELQYEHDLLLAFWLAVDKEDIWLTSILMNFDPSIRFIATLALKRKKECKPIDRKV